MTYEKPIADVLLFSNVDVITASQPVIEPGFSFCGAGPGEVPGPGDSGITDGPGAW